MTYRQLLGSNANIRRLWLGQLVSEVGDWFNNIAVLALTIELAGPRREGLAIAIYAVSRHLPLFIFGPVAGVIADRVDRKRVMIAADLARALLALGFLVANRLAALPAIYVVGAALFSVSSFFNVAKRAALPNLVNDGDELLSANSLSASTTAATIAIGSAVGGVVATFVGRNAVFVINAATFLVSAQMIRAIDRRAGGRPQEVPGERQDGEERASAGGHEGLTALYFLPSVLSRAMNEFREGLRYVRRVRVLSAIFIVAAGWGLGNGVARALYSIFGARLGMAAAAGLVARPTDFGISVLFVAMGIGGMLGAPIARRFNAGSGVALGDRMGRAMFFDGCGLALFSFMPNLWSAALVLVAREVNFAIWWTAQQTILMSRTEDRYSGRVFAAYETVTTLMMVASMVASGAAADKYGILPVAASGGIVVAASGLTWFLLRHRN